MGGRPSFPVQPLSCDRVAVVTGGNTGLGYEVAKWLAIMGAKVIIACRSEERALKALQNMNEDYAKDRGKLKTEHGISEREALDVEFMKLDLASFESTMEFVNNFKATGMKLHMLVCNAALAMSPYDKTVDGIEQMLQVNYLSHFLLTAKLLPVMITSGVDCRVVLVSSEGHKYCTFDIDTISYEGPVENFGRLDYYGRTKLYMVMQMYAMSRGLEGTNVTINSVHPGIIQTGNDRNFSDMFFWSKVFPLMAKITCQFKTPLEGASTILNTAMNPELAGISGVYYSDCKPLATSTVSSGVDNQKKLMQKTMDLLKHYLTAEDVKYIEHSLK